MNEISNIHAFEDEDFLHACFVWGMAVLGAFAVCLVPVFMLMGGPADLDAADAGGWTAILGWLGRLGCGFGGVICRARVGARRVL